MKADEMTDKEIVRLEQINQVAIAYYYSPYRWEWKRRHMSGFSVALEAEHRKLIRKAKQHGLM